MVGNIGDSRAVLATRDKDNALVAVQLTIDLKPDLPSMLDFLFIFEITFGPKVQHVILVSS